MDKFCIKFKFLKKIVHKIVLLKKWQKYFRINILIYIFIKQHNS
jgi:hypothetical protein